MVLSVALVSTDSAAYEAGRLSVGAVGLVLMLGGLVALLRMRRSAPAAPYQQHEPPAAPVRRPPAAERSRNIAIACAGGGLVMVLATIQGTVERAAADGDLGGGPATRLTIPATAGGLARVELAPDVVATLEKRKSDAAAQGIGYHFSGFTNPDDAEAPLLFAGSESENSSPARDLQNFFAGVAEGSGRELGTLTTFPAGDLGGEVRCTTFQVPQGPYVQCAWADHSTFGMLAVLGTSEPRLAELLVRMRPDIEKPR